MLYTSHRQDATYNLKHILCEMQTERYTFNFVYVVASLNKAHTSQQINVQIALLPSQYCGSQYLCANGCYCVAAKDIKMKTHFLDSNSKAHTPIISL